jgi:DNA-3-methyladenine glycosylase II
MTQAKLAKVLPSQDVDVKALLRSDPHLKPFVKQIGVIEVPQPQKFALVDALSRSILYQQLHGKAAETIVQRLLSKLETVVLPKQNKIASKQFVAERLATLSVEEFRAVGVSGNKALALLSLAAADLAGQLPSAQQIPRLSNQALIDALVPLRGIGVWTVQMLLIFRLGRKEVWPVDDFGVRKGVQIAHGLEAMPSAKELRVMSEQYWTGQLTLAALYFWRIADLYKSQRPADTADKSQRPADTADKSQRPADTAEMPVGASK